MLTGLRSIPVTRGTIDLKISSIVSGLDVGAFSDPFTSWPVRISSTIDQTSFKPCR